MNLHIIILMKILWNVLIFFGLHENKEDAIKEALERVIKGYVECDLLPETL